MIATDFASSITSPEIRAKTEAGLGSIAIPPDAIARAIAFDQPPDVDVGEIVVRPTARA